MREISKKDIERRAVLELILYLETNIEDITMQSIKELEKINQLKQIQGLYQKQRIDEKCIKNAIQHLCDEGPLPPRRKTEVKKTR